MHHASVRSRWVPETWRKNGDAEISSQEKDALHDLYSTDECSTDETDECISLEETDGTDDSMDEHAEDSTDESADDSEDKYDADEGDEPLTAWKVYLAFFTAGYLAFFTAGAIAAGAVWMAM